MEIIQIFIILMAISCINSTDPSFEGIEFSFFVKPLSSLELCEEFLNSWQFKFARSAVYKKGSTLYIEPLRFFSLERCLNTTLGIQEKKLLITEFREMKMLEPSVWAQYKIMAEAYKDYVDMVPLMNVIVGPGGNSKNIFTHPSPLMRDTTLILGADEVENITAKYPDHWEKELQEKILPFAIYQVNARMIQLNAWHLLNTHQQLEWDGLKYFMGILLYASPKHRKQLDEAEVMTLIPMKFHRRVYLDIGILDPVEPSNASAKNLPKLIQLLLYLKLFFSIAVN